jgi:P-type Cu+ transporter
MSENKTCYHCGNPPIAQPIVYDDKTFCCSGCKSVYQLLSDSGMEDFYKINNAPGARPKSSNAEKYRYLDSEEIAQKFYLFNEGFKRKISVLLPSIHCSSCIWILENLFRLHEGVKHSEVNFTAKKALITFDISKIKLSELAYLLDSIGYYPVFDAQEETQQKKFDKSLILKLAVAGFAFGNIMLLSFPEYLNVDSTFVTEFRDFFAYVILILSLPILFYSGKDYLVSGYKSIRTKQANLDIPISVGIIALYAKSLYDILTGAGPGYMDSFAGFVFFLLIGKWFQNKTYQTLSFERNYKSYFPLAVTLNTANGEEIIPLEKLKIGDEYWVKNEDIIPTDSELLKGRSHVDYSFVTGESDQISKQVGDKLFAGGKHFGEAILLKAIKKVDQSYLTSLWNQDAFKNDNSKNISAYTAKVSRVFIIAVLILASLSALVWAFIDASQIVNVVVSVLIVACPCALALSVPFTFGHIMRIFGQHQFYLKNTFVVERMASITDIIFDKTGTITQQGKTEVSYHGTALSDIDCNAIFSLAYQSAHPLSRSIVGKMSSTAKQVAIQNFESITGKGIKAIINGDSYLLGSAEFVGVKILNNELISTKVFVSINDEVIGYFQFSNHYREGLEQLINELKPKYKLHVLSGDNASEHENLKRLFGDDVKLNFNQQPIDKLNYIKHLKADGKNVLMFGDGLNDSGALKQSEVGVVIAEDVFNFSPASDAILNATSFLKIPKFLKLSKYGIRVLKYSYVFSLTYNITGFVFAASNLLTPLIAAIIMPLSSITIVAFTTFATRLKSRL